MIWSVTAVSMMVINFMVVLPIYSVFFVGILLFVDLGSIRLEYILYGLVGVCTARGGILPLLGRA